MICTLKGCGSLDPRLLQSRVGRDPLFLGLKPVKTQGYMPKLLRSEIRIPDFLHTHQLWEIWHPVYGKIYDFYRDAPTYVPKEKEEKTTQTANCRFA